MGKMRGVRVCPTHGCPNDIPCTEHARVPWEGSTRASRLPKGWAKLRLRVLRRDRYRCQWPGCTSKATEVDHVTPNDDDAMTNLQSLCSSCHGKKSRAEAAQARRERNQ